MCPKDRRRRQKQQLNQVENKRKQRQRCLSESEPVRGMSEGKKTRGIVRLRRPATPPLYANGRRASSERARDLRRTRPDHCC